MASWGSGGIGGIAKVREREEERHGETGGWIDSERNKKVIHDLTPVGP